ncbi:hypothetical protein [Brenneria tiliae]|uniref:Uncharacterized protein n=1 Tax=Brenneria tiliae TaxID=2914984 RepID=A0ABT0MQ25_9GAMM|nr:hypothetical protein [Brenneria tiliae]MCL2891954.1 hypothetical protein [Brenneria tiliae]
MRFKRYERYWLYWTLRKAAAYELKPQRIRQKLDEKIALIADYFLAGHRLLMSTQGRAE